MFFLLASRANFRFCKLKNACKFGVENLRNGCFVAPKRVHGWVFFREPRRTRAKSALKKYTNGFPLCFVPKSMQCNDLAIQPAKTQV